MDSSRLGGSLRDVEEELEKIQREKMLLGEEVNRLHSVLRDKEETIKVKTNNFPVISQGDTLYYCPPPAPLCC